MLAGAAMAAYALSAVAAEGFAPDGRFPWLIAAVFAAGVLLVALRPAARSATRNASPQRYGTA
jgi:hypothetical protein